MDLFSFFPSPPGKVPVLEKEKLPVVGIGKHLCGAATGVNYICVHCRQLEYQILQSEGTDLPNCPFKLFFPSNPLLANVTIIFCMSVTSVE